MRQYQYHEFLLSNDVDVGKVSWWMDKSRYVENGLVLITFKGTVSNGESDRCGKRHRHRRLVWAEVIAKRILMGITAAGCRAPCGSLVYICVP